METVRKRFGVVLLGCAVYLLATVGLGTVACRTSKPNPTPTATPAATATPTRVPTPVVSLPPGAPTTSTLYNLRFRDSNWATIYIELKKGDVVAVDVLNPGQESGVELVMGAEVKDPAGRDLLPLQELAVFSSARFIFRAETDGKHAILIEQIDYRLDMPVIVRYYPAAVVTPPPVPPATTTDYELRFEGGGLERIPLDLKKGDIVALSVGRAQRGQMLEVRVEDPSGGDLLQFQPVSGILSGDITFKAEADGEHFVVVAQLEAPRDPVLVTVRYYPAGS